MGLRISTWYLYQQSKGRGRGAAPRPCWGKDAQLISSRGKPPREEESHISSAKRHVMTQGKKNHTSFLPRFISLCLTSTSRCSSSQLLYWILGHPRNCCKWEMIPQHLACVHPDPGRSSIHLGTALACSLCSQRQPGNPKSSFDAVFLPLSGC